MPSERVQRHIDRLLDEADQAIALQQWEDLRATCETLLSLDPDNSDAPRYLALADRSLATDVVSDSSEVAEPAQDWVTKSPFARSFASLRNRQFRFLWLSRLCWSSAMAMTTFALLFWADDKGSDGNVVSYVVVVQYSLTVLMGALVGTTVAPVLAVRVESRLLIQLAMAGGVILSGILGIAAFSNDILKHPEVRFCIAFGPPFFYSIWRVTVAVIIPKMVEHQLIFNAFSLQNFASLFGSMFIGPLVGVITFGIFHSLFSQLSPIQIMLPAACSMFLVATIFTSFIGRFPPYPSEQRRSVLAGWTDGFQHVIRHRTLLAVMIFGTVSTGFGIAFNERWREIVSVSDIYNLYGSNRTVIASLAWAFMLGGMIGSLGFANLRPGQPRGMILLATSVSLAIVAILFASIPVLGIGVVLMIPIGAGVSAMNITAIAFFSELTDDRQRAHVLSLLFILSLAVSTLTFFVHLEMISAQALIIVFAVFLIITSLLFMEKMRGLRELR